MNKKTLIIIIILIIAIAITVFLLWKNKDKNAENNVSDFGMISETFNSEKAPSCTSYEVAKDGIALIVNKVNSFDNITLEHLKNIYDCDINGEEKISTWGDLA